MRIVFLDVDGVLVSARHSLRRPGRRVSRHLTKSNVGYAEFDPACVGELNLICDTGRASIVVSSMWREFFVDTDTMREMFQDQGVSAPIIGRTPVFHDADRQRGHEVMAFLEPIGDLVESWVVLDDDDHCWDGDCRSRWIHTDYTTGLTRADAKRALEMLSN